MRKTKVRPLLYHRYVDDIWGLWEGTEEELLQFQETTDNIHPRIKTEMKYSRNSIEFLDVRTILENGKIKTDLHTKDTDKHQYLKPTSNHPHYVIDSIPYSLCIRLKRICSNLSDYNNQKQILKKKTCKSEDIQR